MKKVLIQLYRILLKQKADGQIQVTGIRVPKEIFDNNPFIKQQIKNAFELTLKEKHIKVLGDVGIVQY